MERICTPRPVRGTRESKSGGFHHQDVGGDGVHDELRGVADEKALEPRARHHAHGDDGAALALGGARDRLRSAGPPPGGSGCASRRSRRRRARACAAPRVSMLACARRRCPSAVRRAWRAPPAAPAANTCSACSSPCSACTSCAPARRICRSRLRGLGEARATDRWPRAPAGGDTGCRFFTSSTGNRAQAQQFPVRVGQQPARGMAAGAVMIFDDQQVGGDALRLADDGFVGREVPVGGHVDVDAVFADARGQLLELLAPRRLHFALPGLAGRSRGPAAPPRTAAWRCRETA